MCNILTYRWRWGRRLAVKARLPAALAINLAIDICLFHAAQLARHLATSTWPRPRWSMMTCECEQDFYHAALATEPASEEYDGRHYCRRCLDELIARTLVQLWLREARRGQRL